MQDRTNGPLLLRRLGGELRRVRRESGISQAVVAKALRCSQDTVSNIERGRKKPTDKQIERILTTCEASSNDCELVLKLAGEAGEADRAWWDEYQDVFSPKLLRFFAYEDAAEAIHSYSATYVPGMLQTRRYVEAFAEFLQSDESLAYRKRFVQLRLERRRVIDQGDKLVRCVFLEAGLRAAVGGPDVMREQIASLIEHARRPNVSLHLIPFAAGAAALAGPPFTVMTFPSSTDPNVLFSEMTKNGEFSEEQLTVEKALRRFDHFLRAALSEDDTVRLMEKVAREL
ncbi:helix-turn-helix transcriptional regulator [Streptomyces sp. B6B3]|uniref:helix-turn-helix domain-containing protein n=1 Tax=Streptomyces sp. B6B3 TaxID=3153570 RepID=UPI00325F8B67